MSAISIAIARCAKIRRATDRIIKSILNKGLSLLIVIDYRRSVEVLEGIGIINVGGKQSSALVILEYRILSRKQVFYREEVARGVVE